MTPLADDTVTAALASLRGMLRLDGYDMSTVSASPAGIVLQITAGADACAECLVPASMMSLYVRDALKALPGGAEVPLDLRYPPPHG